MNPMKWPVWVRIAVVVSVWWEGLVFAFTLVSFYSLEGRGYAGFEIKKYLVVMVNSRAPILGWRMDRSWNQVAEYTEKNGNRGMTS